MIEICHDPDRLRQIEELYHSVHKCSAGRREELLAQADPELRREVESLLARRDESLPALDARTMKVMQPGTRLGRPVSNREQDWAKAAWARCFAPAIRGWGAP